MAPDTPAKRGAALDETLNRLRSFSASGARLTEARDNLLKMLASPGLRSLDEMTRLTNDASRRAGEDLFPFIIENMQRVGVAEHSLYRLKDFVRRDLVSRFGSGVLKSDDAQRPFDSFENLLKRALHNQPIEKDDVQKYGVEALLRTVGIVQRPDSPSESQIQSWGRQLQRESWMRAAREGLFVNRREEIDALVEALRSESQPRIIEIQGPAGVGKTSLARRALASHSASNAVILVDTDFERPITSQTLVASIGRDMALAAFDSNALSAKRLESFLRRADDIVDIEILIDDLWRIINESGKLKRWVFFLDSLEVYINAFGDPLGLIDLIEFLCKRMRNCVVLIATRLSTFEFKSPANRISLDNLSKSDIIEYCSMSGLNPITSRFVLNSLPSLNPLLATLLISAVKVEKSINLQDVLDVRPLSNIMFQRYVIERIIAKISSPLIREIAQAAIPIRIITSDLLYNSEIFPSVAHYYETEPQYLFNSLCKQVIFFELSDDRLRLRSDIRSILLQISQSSDHRFDFNQTRRRAFDYFFRLASMDGNRSAATEALYYALVLDMERNLLEDLWSLGPANDIINYIEDMPPRAAAWLKLKAGQRWSRTDFSVGFKEDFDKEIVGFAINAFNSGRFSEVNHFVVRGDMHASPGEASSLFIDAIMELSQLKFAESLDNLVQAIEAAPNLEMQLGLLPMALRSAALNGSATDRLTELAETISQLSVLNSTSEPWEADYFRLWTSRLTPVQGHLSRTVSVLKREQSRRGSHSRLLSSLKNKELAEFCLLASAEDSDFAMTWLKAANFRSLAFAAIVKIVEYLQAEGLTSSLDPSENKSRFRVHAASLLQSYIKSKPKIDKNSLFIIREAMFTQCSEIICGIFISILSDEFSHATAEDRDKISFLVNRKVTSEPRTKTLIASAVRRLYDDGKMYRSIKFYCNNNRKTSIDLDLAVTNWRKCFQIGSEYSY